MASSYTHYSWSVPVGYWYYQVQETNVNANTNTSTITVRFYVKPYGSGNRCESYNLTNNNWAKIWINGYLVADIAPAKFDIRYANQWSSPVKYSTSTYTLATATVNVEHNSDGGGSYSIKCQHYCGNTTPSYVTLENTHNLTKINLVSGSSWSMPSEGTYDIGSSYNMSFYPCNGNVSHHVYVKAWDTDWVNVVWDRKGAGNNWNNLSFTIPEQFRSGLGKMESKTLTIRAQSYNGGTYLNHQDVNIYARNYQHELYLDDLYFVKDLYTNDSLIFHWECVSTLGIQRLDYKVWGAHTYNDDATSSLGSGGTIPAGVMTKAGEVGLTVTITDWGGHTASKTIYGYIKERHYLTINSFKSTNTALYVKFNDVNSGETYVKSTVTWSNSHKITKIEYHLTGANSQYWYQDYPSGTSHTWTSNHLYNAGTNNVKVTIYDEYGDSKSTSFNINSNIEAWSISCSGTSVDKKLCVNLVNGNFYTDYSRVGIRAKVQHTHDLKYITVAIDGKSYNIPNITPNGTEFTFVCNDYFKTAKSVKVQVTAGDVNGRTAYHEETITIHQLITDPPPVPTIKFEEKVSLLLSEGEKVIFTGESKDIKDYQIIYALAPCDVVNATSICNANENSYYGIDSSVLNKNLTSNESSTLSYHILKDFGETASCVTQDEKNKRMYHIHPLKPDHDNSRVYALQWFSQAKPGDSIYIYVKERKQGTLEMLYSDKKAYNQYTKSDMFNMCILPIAPKPLQIYKTIQTDDLLRIEYTNPIFNIDFGDKDPVHLVDVCLIAKDLKGNIINRTDKKKRDGLNGKTWLYYTKRYWHNIYTNNYANKHNFYTAPKFTMDFDISDIPKDSSIYIVAFYYTDYYSHPSIYSTSNIISTGKQTLDYILGFLKPKNSEQLTTANPEIKVRVNYIAEDYHDVTMDRNYIYDKKYGNTAYNFIYNNWVNNPIWIKSPINKDSQVPNFRVDNTNEYYFKVINKDPVSPKKANHALEFYNLHKDIYLNKNLYDIPGLKDNSSSVFIENCLFLRLDDNVVELGDIHTDELIKSGYLDFSWKQEKGRFLSMGKNKLELYTCPYKYGEKRIQYDEINGSWLTEGMFVGGPIMPYNYFADSIVRPSSEKDWSKVEDDVLDIRIPYKLLKPNFSYNLNYKISVDRGFLYDGYYQANSEQEANDLICNAYVFTKPIKYDNINISGDNDKYTDLIYRPSYTVTETNRRVESVNNYNKWINKVVTFTTPNQATMEEMKDEELVIRLSGRGIYKLKVKDFSLISIDKQHVVDAGRIELDRSTIENLTTITVNYTVYNFDFGYIDPLDYEDQTQLRDYLTYLADIYEVQVDPPWRTLRKDHSYLMARDFNDTKMYCQDLFTKIAKQYPDTFKGDIAAFAALPYIQPGERRGLGTYSDRGKHYFPEWDNLIDAIKKQGK
jgi:hypothetical protein